MVFILFPNQLFKSSNKLLNGKTILILNDPHYYYDYNYHKVKLVYHIATIREYKKYLKTITKSNVITFGITKDYSGFYKHINKVYKKIECFDLPNHTIMRKLRRIFGDKLIVYDNPQFLINPHKEKNITLRHSEFYKYMRRKLEILVDKKGTPLNGKWSYDEDNRDKLPKDIELDNVRTVKSSSIKYAIKIVNNIFPNNYGDTNLIFPINRKDAIRWLNKFLDKRLQNFGQYQDAIHDNIDSPLLFHSGISPMMNVGLLTDMDVVNAVLKYYAKHKKTIPIESFEGFIRQVIGWRNYMYYVYMNYNDKIMSLVKTSKLKHNNKLPYELFWTANTGMLPVDNAIKKIIKYGYAHHIERLMILGNYMFICKIDPNDVYKIFMEWTIDAYEWVMVPNVYCMSQFACERLITTRPYYSSSNYILKMSNYKSNADWCNKWDKLYHNITIIKKE